jgi:hypothetical protein
MGCADCWGQDHRGMSRRLDGGLALLPPAQKQAHERIIGERRVDNAGKVLTLYETDTRVIVRGKAGGEVEFGNTLLLAEQQDGVIVDWQLHRDSAPADARQLVESVARIETAYGVGTIRALGTDRGFCSTANQTRLQAKGIYDGIGPKHPGRLKERMTEEQFVQRQRRRSQTEGRIAIFKNGFLGRALRAKGFAHRELAVTWQVLTHNLWVLARPEQRPALALAAWTEKSESANTRERSARTRSKNLKNGRPRKKQQIPTGLGSRHPARISRHFKNSCFADRPYLPRRFLFSLLRLTLKVWETERCGVLFAARHTLPPRASSAI